MNKKNPIVHFEIPADDTKRAMDFYAKTFGWEFNLFEIPSTGSAETDSYYGVITTEVDEKRILEQ